MLAIDFFDYQCGRIICQEVRRNIRKIYSTVWIYEKALDSIIVIIQYWIQTIFFGRVFQHLGRVLKISCEAIWKIIQGNRYWGDSPLVGNFQADSFSLNLLCWKNLVKSKFYFHSIYFESTGVIWFMIDQLHFFDPLTAKLIIDWSILSFFRKLRCGSKHELHIFINPQRIVRYNHSRI